MAKVEQSVHNVSSVLISITDLPRPGSGYPPTFRTITMMATSDDGTEVTLKAFTHDLTLLPEAAPGIVGGYYRDTENAPDAPPS